MLIPLARVSLIFNAAILSGVALNMEWVRSRAAGGSFETFPWGIRALYSVQLGFTLLLLWYLTRATRRWSALLALLFSVSTLLQLVSRSPDERWNALPAAVIAVAFFNRSRSKV